MSTSVGKGDSGFVYTFSEEWNQKLELAKTQNVKTIDPEKLKERFADLSARVKLHLGHLRMNLEDDPKYVQKEERQKELVKEIDQLFGAFILLKVKAVRCAKFQGTLYCRRNKYWWWTNSARISDLVVGSAALVILIIEAVNSGIGVEVDINATTIQPETTEMVDGGVEWIQIARSVALFCSTVFSFARDSVYEKGIELLEKYILAEKIVATSSFTRIISLLKQIHSIVRRYPDLEKYGPGVLHLIGQFGFEEGAFKDEEPITPSTEILRRIICSWISKERSLFSIVTLPYIMRVDKFISETRNEARDQTERMTKDLVRYFSPANFTLVGSQTRANINQKMIADLNGVSEFLMGRYNELLSDFDIFEELDLESAKNFSRFLENNNMQKYILLTLGIVTFAASLFETYKEVAEEGVFVVQLIVFILYGIVFVYSRLRDCFTMRSVLEKEKEKHITRIMGLKNEIDPIPSVSEFCSVVVDFIAEPLILQKVYKFVTLCQLVSFRIHSCENYEELKYEDIFNQLVMCEISKLLTGDKTDEDTLVRLILDQPESRQSEEDIRKQITEIKEIMIIKAIAQRREKLRRLGMRYRIRISSPSRDRDTVSDLRVAKVCEISRYVLTRFARKRSSGSISHSTTSERRERTKDKLSQRMKKVESFAKKVEKPLQVLDWVQQQSVGRTSSIDDLDDLCTEVVESDDASTSDQDTLQQRNFMDNLLNRVSGMNFKSEKVSEGKADGDADIEMGAVSD